MGTKAGAKNKSTQIIPQLKTKTQIPAQDQVALDDSDSGIEEGNLSSSPAPEKRAIVTRNMTGVRKVITDLYKLTVAKVIKYEGWDEANEHPETHPNKFSTWEHTHPFRTFDKKGEKLYTSTPIGGHFHVIEWEPSKNPDEPPRIKSCSGPMVMGREKIRGRSVAKPVPANEYDDHTHDVEYIRSSEVEFSTANVEAAKVIAMDSQKTAPLPGVIVK